MKAKDQAQCEADTGKTCQYENNTAGFGGFCFFMCKEHNILWEPCVDDHWNCYCCHYFWKIKDVINLVTFAKDKVDKQTLFTHILYLILNTLKNEVTNLIFGFANFCFPSESNGHWG